MISAASLAAEFLFCGRRIVPFSNRPETGCFGEGRAYRAA
jgi:hypothetical protein